MLVFDREMLSKFLSTALVSVSLEEVAIFDFHRQRAGVGLGKQAPIIKKIIDLFLPSLFSLGNLLTSSPPWSSLSSVSVTNPSAIG